MNELSRQGKINKVHGGAMLPEGEFESQEQDVHTKEGIQVEQKERIARYAAKQVCDDDFVFIDAGTTTLKMVDFLNGSNGNLWLPRGLNVPEGLQKKDFVSTFREDC